MSKALFKNINESKNKFKITDFPEGSKILFNDSEEWIVVKKGMRGSGSWRNSDEITIKPFNKLAKDKNVSLPIDVNLEFLNANVKEINESEINESNNIEVGTFVRYKKDKDFTGGKVKSIKGGKAEIHNWDGSTSELPLKDLEYVKSWNESEVNEAMSFDEIKDKFVENPYGIGANVVEFIEGKNGNSSMLIFKHDEKHRRDQIESRLKTLGISPKKMSKSTADRAYKYRYELILHENVLEETNEVNEGRSQIKRKYGEHGAIRVNSEAPVRNSILEFVGKRFVTRAELDSHLTQLSEDRGKSFNHTTWFKNNERYFESFSNRGSEVWTLSKYGKRVLENIIKSKQEKTMIKESIGLFKFDTINEAIDHKKSATNEAKSPIFSFNYNTEEDDVDYIQGLLKDARVDAIAQPGLESDEMVIKAKNEVELRKAKKAIQANGFEIHEAIDVKYWADYNDDTSGQGKKEDAEKSNKFNKDFFNKAMNSWNSEAESGSSLRAFSSEYSKIYKMAEEFFKKAGWISVNVIHAMIMQES
jgi:hypothetical protein